MTDEPRVVAYVEWVDAAIAATGWTQRDDALEEAARIIGGLCRSTGFLLERTDERIVLALSLNPNNDDVNLVLAIPTSCVRRIELWEPPLAVVGNVEIQDREARAPVTAAVAADKPERDGPAGGSTPPDPNPRPLVECEGCHRMFRKGPGIYGHRAHCPALHPGEITQVTSKMIEPQQPGEEDERYFEAIRRLGKDASYADVGRDTKAAPARISQRLSLLASYYTLPSDIAVWRAHRSTQKGGIGGADARIAGFRQSEEDAVRAVAAEIRAREPEMAARAEEIADEFAERRRKNVAAAASATWSQRTGG